VIHNPVDRMAKLLKQVRAVARNSRLRVEYFGSPAVKDRKAAEWYGDRPYTWRERRACGVYNRRQGGTRYWGPCYSCLCCRAEKPERALRNALAKAKLWQKNAKVKGSHT
jgi:hypothetical protein